jgi:hypothetical protein
MRSVRDAVELANANAVSQLVDYARSSDERDVVSARTQFASDPATDCACTKDCDAWHTRTLPRAAYAMHFPLRMNALIKHPKNEKGAAGYILAWILGIPLPILLIIFLVRGCN